jgi:putative SOS response-associated peptidase YedK
MCGRYTVFTEDEIIEMREIIYQIGQKFGPEAVKTGEIFPADVAPIVRVVDGRVEIGRGTWGFPKRDGKGVIINARSDTAFEKPMFAKPLRRSRCVIPSTGYYEWTHEGKKAVDKYLFRQPETPMLYFAGMVDSFMGADGEMRDHFVILTQKPNKCVAPFHDRMPVILQKSELAEWLRHDDYVRLVFAREGPELMSARAG